MEMYSHFKPFSPVLFHLLILEGRVIKGFKDIHEDSLKISFFIDLSNDD
jgi:hypothetical protein